MFNIRATTLLSSQIGSRITRFTPAFLSNSYYSISGHRENIVSQEPEHAPTRTADAPPPFLRTWRNVYVFVVIYLACLITGFYFFARAFAP
jgi:hypothetical protein